MPCTLDKYDWCGLWVTFGCLKDNLHEILGKGKRVYIKQYQRSCYRPSCVQCYLKWIARAANRATRRIEEFGKLSGMTAKQILLSVSDWDYGKSIKELRKKE